MVRWQEEKDSAPCMMEEAIRLGCLREEEIPVWDPKNRHSVLNEYNKIKSLISNISLLMSSGATDSVKFIKLIPDFNERRSAAHDYKIRNDRVIFMAEFLHDIPTKEHLLQLKTVEKREEFMLPYKNVIP